VRTFAPTSDKELRLFACDSDFGGIVLSITGNSNCSFWCNRSAKKIEVGSLMCRNIDGCSG